MNHTAEHIEADNRVAQAVEEYFDRVARGDKPKLVEFLQRYPDISGVLRNVIPALEITENREPDRLSLPEIEVNQQGRQLGDFRIRGQIGRGGMGVVYEADQISMGRRVALKVLPLAGLVDDVRIQRFQNEVRAVAALNHPHIVSVYMVGEERGVHYYAMQLIRGRSLADVIESLRQLRNNFGRLDGDSISELTGAVEDEDDGGEEITAGEFVERNGETIASETVACAGGSTYADTIDRAFYRSVVSLGVQAAEALHHAHDQGVIHRDIKPGNLLLDRSTKLFVTDFGLARVGADAGVTMTGDLVGTLRYMAPEQALAQRVVVDGRADVYSLGVTLYELLTLRRPFESEDRQALLKQIAFEDPPPVRRIDRRIPHELETIIGKAIAKDPDERYATMEAFANDLKAFLDDRPIKAKPPTTLQYASKWARRHRAAVAASLTALAAILLCLVASTVVVSGAWLEQRQATQVALSERDEARYRNYVGDMRLAGREWAFGDVSSVLDCLAPYSKPQLHDLVDHRGWEWYMMSSLCHQAVSSLDHQQAVNCVQYSPDGTKVATAGFDNQVRIWDAKRLADPTVLARHEGGVRSIAWSPDGQALASGSYDGTIVIWDVVGARSTHVISAEHSEDYQQPIQVAWSPDGGTLAASVLRSSKTPERRGPAVFLWNTDDWSTKSAITAEPERIQAIAWKPDSSQLALGGNYRKKRLVIWDAVAGQMLKEIEPSHDNGLRSVAWSPDGNHLATASNDKHVKIWDTSTWQVVHDIHAHQGDVWTVAWRPDGLVIASGGGDTLVKLWDFNTGDLIREFKGHVQRVMQVAWTPDGNQLASASIDHTVKIWDANRDRAKSQILAYASIALSPDGRQLAAPTHETAVNGSTADDSTSDRLLSIFDLETRREIRRLEFEDEDEIRRLGRCSWSPDGAHLAARVAVPPYAGGDCEEAIAIWKVDEQKIVQSLPGGRVIDWSPDGKSLGISSFGGGVKVYDFETGDVRAELKTRSAADKVSYAPDGKHLAVYDWSQRVHIWETTSWNKTAELEIYPDDSHLWGRGTITWSPDGESLAAVGQAGAIVVWDPFSKTEKARFRASASDVTALAFSPDGNRLASGGRDGVFRIWDARTWLQLLSQVDRVDDGAIARILWTPDGRKIICAGSDRIHIWDASSGYELAQAD